MKAHKRNEGTEEELAIIKKHQVNTENVSKEMDITVRKNA
jgi:hypothetical protein